MSGKYNKYDINVTSMHLSISGDSHALYIPCFHDVIVLDPCYFLYLISVPLLLVSSVNSSPVRFRNRGPSSSSSL